ncbi:MAG TPA: glycoside hydrolase family 3 N-terminal domain-containing protein, partial [Flavobacteriales bacterium]|nr:glycoside hydrolase family 3 N-terminal domain-containing protein [Flavobacteriales bacterium]
MKRLLILLAIAVPALLGLSSARPQPVLEAHPPRSLEAPPFLRTSALWADSVLSTLSLDERIAQLMMVAAYSNKGEKHEREIEALIRDRNIGGLIFFQGGPARQARLTNRYQALARTPILIGMDLEWGLGMRLDSTMKFPHQMALGAVQDESLIT